MFWDPKELLLLVHLYSQHVPNVDTLPYMTHKFTKVTGVLKDSQVIQLFALVLSGAHNDIPGKMPIKTHLG